ncbi:Condensin-2 complex subunit H2 C-terminal [Trinorchestia longiramus]|nr:Condensin-2 complex subunit H2 C-terminal [Trinorchestia longiramus]
MPLPSTQDLDARFSVFLNPIRDLTKNWEVDIAKYLEEYLEELAEVQITFDGGETMMNFAEAAMLIQGSATVYSKKVEFLWQMVLQMLELLSSKRKFETQGEGDAEGSATGSGKSKPNIHDHTVDFKNLDNLGEGRNITMKEEEEEEGDDVDDFGRKKSFAFLPATPLHLVEKESEKSKNRVNIFLSNGETIGGKDDFRLNRSYMTPKGLLCLDLPTELLRQEEEVMVVPAIQELLATIPEEAQMDFGSDREFSPERHSPLPMLDDGPQLDLSPVRVSEPERETEVPVVADADMEQELQPIDIRRNGLRRRAVAECIVTRPIKLDEPWKPMDPHEQSSPSRPVRAGRLRRPPPCSCHKATPSRSKKRKKGANIESVSLLPIDQHLLKHLPDLANNNMQSSEADLHPALRDQILEEEAARAVLLRQGRVLAEKVCEGVTEAVVDGLQQLPLGEEAAYDDVGDDDDDDGGGDMGPAIAFDLPDPHSGLLEDEGGGGGSRRSSVPPSSLNDTLHYEAEGEYEALVQQRVVEYLINAQDYIASSDLTRRVNKWRSKITPILTLEETRQAFDIHGYGDQILRCFTTNGPEECIPFRNIVTGMQRNEVSRMFLSSLMLANTYNVEPILTESGDMAMDCLTLRLLSRVRHHEEMEDYVAPSQHTAAPADANVPFRRFQSSPSNSRKRLPPKGTRQKTTNKAKVTRRVRTSFSLSDSDTSDSDSSVSTSSTEPRVNGVVSPLDHGAVDAVMDGLAVCTDITHKAVNDPHLRQDRAPKRVKNVDVVER